MPVLTTSHHTNSLSVVSVIYLIIQNINTFLNFKRLG